MNCEASRCHLGLPNNTNHYRDGIVLRYEAHLTKRGLAPSFEVPFPVLLLKICRFTQNG
jgi:hypothetical protein